MILKDLIKEIPFKEVKRKLPILYPAQKKSVPGYEALYKSLLRKRARKSSTIIDIEWIKDKDTDSGGYWDVHGKEPNNDTKWALDLSTFSQWLGFAIGPDIPSRKDKVDLLCHVLWEMTFHGFSDKETRKLVRTLNRSMKEIKNGTAKLTEFKLEDL
jgi:hypothetical protein